MSGFAGIGHNNPPKESGEEKPKTCYCHTCSKWFAALGIMSHRAMHRRRGEDCVIDYESRGTLKHSFGSRAALAAS